MNEPTIPETVQNNPSPPQNAEGPSSKAIVSLILGILSICLLGFLAGIPAFFIGRSEEKAIKKGTSPIAGQTFAKLGWILGLVGTILSCLVTGVAVVVMALGIFYGMTPGGF